MNLYFRRAHHPFPTLRDRDRPHTAVVVAVRGSCTYSTKAKHAQEASASSLLIVNNEEGIVHPPGPDGKGLSEYNHAYSALTGKTVPIFVLASGSEQKIYFRP